MTRRGLGGEQRNKAHPPRAPSADARDTGSSGAPTTPKAQGPKTGLQRPPDRGGGGGASLAEPSPLAPRPETCAAPPAGRKGGRAVIQTTAGASLGLSEQSQPAELRAWVRSLDREDPLEKGTATHSSLLAWRIPWTVQSMGSQSVRHD